MSSERNGYSELLALGVPATSLDLLDEKKLQMLFDVVNEHTDEGQHWLQAHKSLIKHVVVDDLGTVLFYLTCCNCKGTAIFTAEGPNDEYPEPLCERCEEGDE